MRTLVNLDGRYIGTGPLSTASPSSPGLYTLCGQPASSLPPLNEVINVLPSPRAGTQPADGRYLLHPPTPQQPLPMYRRFIAAVAFPPLPHNSSVLVFPPPPPPVSLFAPIHPSEYSWVVSYVVIGYRKYSPGCNKCAATLLMGL